MSRRREQLAHGQLNTIVFDSYVSATDGPTIRIDVHSLSRLSELESAMRDLATGRLQRVDLSRFEDTHWVPPLREIVLNLSTGEGNVVNKQRSEQLVCTWMESAEGWQESAEKIAHMGKSGKPCHQYFEGRHHDTVTVELAYLE
jgi:hypothetical protein